MCRLPRLFCCYYYATPLVPTLDTGLDTVRKKEEKKKKKNEATLAALAAQG